MEKLKNVDILRAIAILSVFTYHVTIAIFGNYQSYKSVYTSKERLLQILPFAYGHTGVELFLVISGFLIHLGFLKTQVFDPRSFFNKRFWRIVPPYLIALVIFVLSLPQPFSSLDILSHATLTHNLSDKYFFSINPSFWSLALEMQL